jgi:hypothetical protein
MLLPCPQGENPDRYTRLRVIILKRQFSQLLFIIDKIIALWSNFLYGLKWGSMKKDRLKHWPSNTTRKEDRQMIKVSAFYPNEEGKKFDRVPF